jgi:hypothetical protein
MWSIQGTFREHSEKSFPEMLTALRTKPLELLKFVLEACDMTRSGNIQGTFREHSGNIQGTFRKKLSRNVDCTAHLAPGAPQVCTGSL